MIRNDIKQIDTSKATYPTPDDIADIEKNREFLPESLIMFLSAIIKEKKDGIKVISIGQAIAQAARPRVFLAPLQIGLAVQMHHHFASKFLIDTLSAHGFSSSYSEVKKFELCAANTPQTNALPLNESHHFLQYVADNVDHNVRTLDGYNTFHGMGIIAAVTPGIAHQKRLNREATKVHDITQKAKIDISYFKPKHEVTNLLYCKQSPIAFEDPTTNLDLLWKIAWPLRSPRPGWSGLMQSVCVGQYPGKSKIQFLPMIDMDPSDMSCIYSTLRYICSEAKRHHVTPVITFDQPLWWKAQIIIGSGTTEADSDLEDIVLRLGGFHTEMSFLGSIGHLMSGSGLEEVLGVVYAPNTVTHMLSGKALARAVRGHYLVDSALNALIACKAFNFPLPKDECIIETEETENQEGPIDWQTDRSSQQLDQSLDAEMEEDETFPDDAENIDRDLEAALYMYDQLLTGERSPDCFGLEEVFDQLHLKLENEKLRVGEGRTAKLWLQYMVMVDLLREFIKAERTGNWMLHLKSAQAMLPYLAAAGHTLYAKSIYIYVQQMLDLKIHQPNVHDAFMAGHHVIRRSDRYWGGLSTDLAIEQTLMRTTKTSGGLTRGRGIDESQRAQWLLALPACSEINTAMQQVTKLAFETSEQHKEISHARKSRDDKDIRGLLRYLKDRSPFERDASLQNIATGMTSNSSNPDMAKEVGCKIIKSMEGTDALEYTFKKKDRVIIMNSKPVPVVDGETIDVNPQLLFQRLLTVAGGTVENMADIFTYELCSVPPSLFENSGLPRQANKPALADAIWLEAQCKDMTNPITHVSDDPADMVYVIDGGSLLHRLPWPRGSTFGAICQMYGRYLQKFNTRTIVFDGYKSPSTKDITHLRRSGGGVGAEVNFNDQTMVSCKKEHFLANTNNKNKFIIMLGEYLKRDGCTVVHAEGDADVLIARTAVNSNARAPTTVIGEDTDLLVLLCFHCNTESPFPLVFYSDKKTAAKKLRIWDIRWVCKSLGSEVCSLLPFLHAIGGCDTSCRLFGIGKGLPLRKIKNPRFKQLARTFMENNPDSKKTIHQAGEEAIVCLYGGKPEEGLDALRYRKFCEKACVFASPVQIHTLPPTSSSAQYHSERVYHQVRLVKALHNRWY